MHIFMVTIIVVVIVWFIMYKDHSFTLSIFLNKFQNKKY